jgi:hypothetical protein
VDSLLIGRTAPRAFAISVKAAQIEQLDKRTSALAIDIKLVGVARWPLSKGTNSFLF